MKRIAPLLLSILLITTTAIAGDARHYIVTASHDLSAAEQSALEADGVQVQHILPRGRYLVRAGDLSAVRANPSISAVEAYGASHKVTPLARRVAASPRAFVALNVRFHDDVSIDDARTAVEALGGTIDTLLPLNAQRLTIRIPPSHIAALAADDHVFGIYGPPLKAAPVNSVAALLSHVTPLYSAPYGLDGTGVVLSMHEPPSCTGSVCESTVDASHPEFSGRVTTHDPDKIAEHGTHVAGTMIAKGIDPLAKGMAPNATIQMYGVGSNNDDPAAIAEKGADLPPLNVTANNNSWGFQLGWQPDERGFWVWYGVMEYYGAYDSFYSAAYDKVATRTAPNVLFVHSAGNDGVNGIARTPPFPHKHVDATTFDVVTDENFCISADGSGTDCPTTRCSTGISTKVTDDNGDPVPHCERTPHPVYGPFNTMSFIASEKNIVAVGAVDSSVNIADFSSRGPALDGRVKPDLVAMGVGQYSTFPNNSYATEDGTSMSSPVVTGISALLVQQWRQTFGGRTPTAQQVKTLLIAGADDVGNPGPDYTFGFGLVNAQAAIDLIRADNGTGARIRTVSMTNGQTVDVPFIVSAPHALRVVAGWADPEAPLPPATDTEDPFADATLVNDIDLKVVDANGNTVLPYVLDKKNPTANATRGANHVDNTEEVEIASAQPGVYHAILTGTSVPVAPQTVILVANTGAPCGDVYEPNDTPATAFNYILNQQRVTARICWAQDLDYFNIQVPVAGPLSISITTTDTPIRVTLTGPGVNTSVTVAAGQTQTLSAFATAGTYTVKVEPAGTVGSDAHYTFTPTFTLNLPPHTRRAGH